MLVQRLERTGGVAAILVHRGAAHLPKGDLVVVHGTNQAAAATRLAGELGLTDRGCVSIGEPVGLAAGDRRDEIKADNNDASWEEIITLLRRDSNPSHNFLALMTLAGALASCGLYNDTLPLVVAAMLVAPGFESLVRIAVGLASSQAETARRGVVAMLTG